MTTGNKIKTIRTRKGLTQNQLAKLVNTSQSALAAYENDSSTPKLETLERIAAALDVPALSLLPSNLTEGAVTLTQEEAELFTLVEELNPEGREKVKSYAADLSKIPIYRRQSAGRINRS